MGRPSTAPKKLKDGFYVEVRNKGSKSGIKVRRDNEEEMLQCAEEYKRTKDVVVLGESVNGKFLNDIKKKKTRAKKAKK